MVWIIKQQEQKIQFYFYFLLLAIDLTDRALEGGGVLGRFLILRMFEIWF